MVGRNFLENLERKRRLLERLERLERELQEEQERLRAREVDWALQALCAVLEETQAWARMEEKWREVAQDRFDLWRALGLTYLLPGEEGLQARLEVGARTIADKLEERECGGEQEEREGEPEGGDALEQEPGPSGVGGVF